jgi:mono/diheme cytochrome c family protein
MKYLLKTLLLMLAIVALGCGDKKEGKDGFSMDRAKQAEQKTVDDAPRDKVPASERITLDNKGVGQIKSLSLDAEIDPKMAEAGAALFKSNCTACHKVEKRFIGPSPKGIMSRRSPEWIMNMILDPQLMVAQDRCAKDLLVEFNGAAMANQNITVEEARAILEYFRTL